MPRPPTFVLLLCLLAGLAALGGASLGIFRAVTADTPDWLTLGMHASALPGAIVVLLIGAGRFRAGPAIALLFCAVSFLAAAGLASLSVGVNVFSTPGMIKTLRNPSGGAEFAAAAICLLSASLAVLLRNPAKSFRSLAIGGALGLVAGALLFPLWRFGAQISTLHPVVLTIGAVFVGLLILGFVSAAAHFVIRAFEHGRPPAPTPPRPATTHKHTPKGA